MLLYIYPKGKEVKEVEILEIIVKVLQVIAYNAMATYWIRQNLKDFRKK